MGRWTRSGSALAVAGLLGLASAAAAGEPQLEGPEVRAVDAEKGAGFRAVRTQRPPELDGQLDDAVWREAPVFDGFVQSFPRPGAAPSERTEVRVLYDDRNLYVGVYAHDSQPALIARGLGRRDKPPASDLVTVVVDPGPTRRTGYAFTINAGGTLKDALYYDDIQLNPDWDAIWDARAVVQADGWSAELVVPLDVLRFTATPSQELVWGLHVRRELRRTTEKLDSALMPVNANGFVSRFARLEGLTALTPPRTVQLLPYVAGRGVLRPLSSDSTGALPRLALPSADVGLDVRANLSSDMSLTATINPDFGQVEADNIILNLGNSEVFFPEKRPFFNQGLDVFAPVRIHFGDGPHRLFYSRRVGLDTPVLGAAKLVGSVADGLEVGVLEALVTGAANPAGASPSDATEPERDTRVQFHPQRPFHLGLNGELPTESPLTRNVLAATVRQRVLDSSFVGLSLTDVTLLTRRCSSRDLGEGELTLGAFQDAGCVAPSTAAGLDFNLKSSNGEWGVLGQLSGSRRNGDGPRLRLRDGTLLDTGDLGWGVYLNAGKMGGEPFRLYAYYEASSPTLDLNAAGFNANQNLQAFYLDARLVRSEALGPFRNSALIAYAGPRWSTDGTGLYRGMEGGLVAATQLPNASNVELSLGFEDGGADQRDIRYQGIPYQKAGSVSAAAFVATDQSRPLSVGVGFGGYRNTPQGELATLGGVFTNLNTTWRPLPALETSLSGSFNQNAFTARYLEGTADSPLLFAALRMPQLSVTLRQQVVLTSTLTLQAYAQLFGARGTYGPYYGAAPHAAGSLVRMTELRRLTPEALEAQWGARSDDFEVAQLNLNVVLRWEYRLGSTLFAVYSRSQSNNPEAPLSGSLMPASLNRGPASDVFMLKWTYLWDARV